MSVRLYVGNLPFSISEQEVEEMFGQIGVVESTNLVTDRDTGRSRGFAFVEMDTREAAEAAIATLNGREIDGRALTVNEARPREDRAPRGGQRALPRVAGRQVSAVPQWGGSRCR